MKYCGPSHRDDAVGLISTMSQVPLLPSPTACILFGSQNSRAAGADFFAVSSSRFELLLHKKITAELPLGAGAAARAMGTAARSGRRF